jgi:mono/diheme cytochrome c family protein
VAAADSGAAAAPSAPAAPAKPAVDAAADAAQIFKDRCSVCHGLSGHGDGPASAGLKPPPRNYSDEKWQASVTDEHIEKTIVNGGASVGLSPLMVPNPDLGPKPETVKELRKIIRGFKGK